ncbi:MAG: hypothetical protein HUU37_01305 [Bdellovibrionales bacterium]|nr:hypothetical protein [Bdellovibrionales bacterium]
MKIKKVLAVYRLPIFSNNAVEADRLILEESTRMTVELSRDPLRVDFVEEPELEDVTQSYDLVLTMAQSQSALKILGDRRDLFPAVWNSSEAIRSCYRRKMAETLRDADVGFAPFSVVQSKADVGSFWRTGSSFWLKRSDFHAISDDDVTLAETPEEARVKMAGFVNKGVGEVLAQPHVNGDIWKFYGVEGGEFFRAIRVRRLLEKDVPLNAALLQRRARRAAELLGLQVWGGDVVVDAKGGLHMIDLNDWPSFRICRPEASRAIGKLAAAFLDGSVSPSSGAGARHVSRSI